MRHIYRILALVCVAMAGACASPLAPSYTCYTQPRGYVSPTGVQMMEIDHYTQSTPCPLTPIE
jgi:hypothetical protein